MLDVLRNRYPAGLRQARHAHAETTVTFVLSGTLRERVGRREELAGPLSFVVKPRDTEHANVFGRNVQTLQIVVNASEVDELQVWNRSLGYWRWQQGALIVRAFLSLLRIARESQGSVDPDHLLRAAFDVLAAICLDEESRPRGVAPRWLATIRQALDEECRMPSVGRLAEGAGVHPVYLARQFRRWYGCSITEHARHSRARRAAQAILETSRSLSHASYAAGFADHAHMCRVFRRETGLTPAGFRALISR